MSHEQHARLQHHGLLKIFLHPLRAARLISQSDADTVPERLCTEVSSSYSQFPKRVSSLQAQPHLLPEPGPDISSWDNLVDAPGTEDICEGFKSLRCRLDRLVTKTVRFHLGKQDEMVLAGSASVTVTAGNHFHHEIIDLVSDDEDAEAKSALEERVDRLGYQMRAITPSARDISQWLLFFAGFTLRLKRGAWADGRQFLMDIVNQEATIWNILKLSVQDYRIMHVMTSTEDELKVTKALTYREAIDKADSLISDLSAEDRLWVRQHIDAFVIAIAKDLLDRPFMVHNPQQVYSMVLQDIQDSSRFPGEPLDTEFYNDFLEPCRDVFAMRVHKGHCSLAPKRPSVGGIKLPTPVFPKSLRSFELLAAHKPKGAMHGPTGIPDHTERLTLRKETVASVAQLLPDICLAYVGGLFDAGVDLLDPYRSTMDNLIDQILLNNKDEPYPKKAKATKSLKRKHHAFEDEAAREEYTRPDRVFGNHALYEKEVLQVLENSYRYVPVKTIRTALTLSKTLFGAYELLEKAVSDNLKDGEGVTAEENPLPFRQLVHMRNRRPSIAARQRLKPAETEEQTNIIDEIVRELTAARTHVARKSLAVESERKNLRAAIAEGRVAECGVCFDELPINRMTHCNSQDKPHLFCMPCAKMNAQTELGKGKYELKCPSMDFCSAGFSLVQRDKFCDATERLALDKLEMRDVLHQAGISEDDIGSCPFCPYTIEYKPVTIDREFRCQNEDCMKTSCRLCSRETHIPLTCEEITKLAGLDVRKVVAEEMSSALIRRCGNCTTPFVKLDGCNKMTCNTCHHVQCYVCSKPSTYAHFNDPTRGGAEGNCPLFDNGEKRHIDEVAAAEATAIAKVLAENPHLVEADVKIVMSDAVKKDAQAGNERYQMAAPMGYRGRVGRMRGRMKPYLLDHGLQQYNNFGVRPEVLRAQAAVARMPRVRAEVQWHGRAEQNFERAARLERALAAAEEHHVRVEEQARAEILQFPRHAAMPRPRLGPEWERRAELMLEQAQLMVRQMAAEDGANIAGAMGGRIHALADRHQEQVRDEALLRHGLR